jgi:hypothetical protein
MNENLTTNSINIIKCTENKLQQLAQKHTRQKKEEQKCIQIQEWLASVYRHSNFSAITFYLVD